jgi:PAS domain S-box-containing protein
VIARDVTEQRAAEARRSATVRAALDAIVTMDSSGRIVEFNPAAERMFGYTNVEAVGRLVADTLVPPDQRNAHLNGLGRYLATGEGPLLGRQVEITAMRSDATTFPAEIAITVLPLEGQVAFTAHIRDISRRREAEHALIASETYRREILADLLRAQEDERSRIATELHDDTVQVMTATMLSLDRLVRISRKGDHARIESAVAHARAVLEEATDRTRRLMFELRPAILHERGLAEALGMLADQTARETGAATHVDVHAGRYDPASEGLVYRTVQEALSNVRKHARPNTITIRLVDAADTLTGEVRDDGRGFDLDAVRRRREAALHLGLDSMTERVRAAGGDLNITTAPDKGTSIVFSLPLAREREPHG